MTKNRNKEKQKLYAKNHYNKNKALIHSKNNTKVFCECGCCLNQSSLSRHLVSTKHLNSMMLKEHFDNI